MLVRLAKVDHMKLVIVCVECGVVAHAPFDNERLLAKEVFRELGWILSFVDPKGQLLVPLCGPCAERAHSPDVLKEATRALSDLD